MLVSNMDLLSAALFAMLDVLLKWFHSIKIGSEKLSSRLTFLDLPKTLEISFAKNGHTGRTLDQVTFKVSLTKSYLLRSDCNNVIK